MSTHAVVLPPEQHVTVFGVDPGLTAGYGVLRWNGREATAVDWGSVTTTPEHGAIDARVTFILERLRIVARVHPPTGVAVEGWGFYKDRSPKDAFSVGLVAGGALCGLGAPGVIAGTAQEWHQAIGLPGSADKKDVQGYLQRVFRMPKPPTPTHAADALGVALASLPRILAAVKTRARSGSSR